MDTTWAPQAPVVPHQARALARLCAFVLASVALHVLAITSYIPRAGEPMRPDAGAAPVLHASLVQTAAEPLRAAETAATAVQNVRSPASPKDAQRDRGASARAGTLLQPVDQWYAASELDFIAAPLAAPALAYPEELAGSGKTARVRLKVFVDETGLVRKVEIQEPRPEAAFERAATRVWEDLRFSPAMKDGTPVKSQKLLELQFSPE